MKEMTLPITSVSSSYSFPDDGRKRVLGTFSPVYSMGSSHQNSELCGTKEINSNVVPSPGIPATSPRLSQNLQDSICSRSLGQEVTGVVKKLLRTSPSCCEAPWNGNCSSWGRGPGTRSWGKRGSEGGRLCCEWWVTQCTPPLGPSPRRKKPGRN